VELRRQLQGLSEEELRGCLRRLERLTKPSPGPVANDRFRSVAEEVRRINETPAMSPRLYLKSVSEYPLAVDLPSIDRDARAFESLPDSLIASSEGTTSQPPELGAVIGQYVSYVRHRRRWLADLLSASRQQLVTWREFELFSFLQGVCGDALFTR